MKFINNFSLMLLVMLTGIPSSWAFDRLEPADPQQVINQRLQGSLETDGYELRRVQYSSSAGVWVDKELVLIRNSAGANAAYQQAGLSYDAWQEAVQDFQQPVQFSQRMSQQSAIPQYVDDDSDGMVLIIDKEADALSSQAAADRYMQKWGLTPDVGGDELDAGALSSEYGTSCPRKWKCRSRDFAKNFEQNLDKNHVLTKNDYGSVGLEVKGLMKADAKAKIDYRYKRKFGVIYKVKVDFLNSALNYRFEGSLRLHGKADRTFAGQEFELFQMKIYDQIFMVGFIPVQVDIKTYLRAGTGDLKLSAAGEIGMQKPLLMHGSFSYVCDGEQCVKQGETFDNLDETLDAKNLNYQLLAKAEIEPYINAAIRGRLYWGSIYAEVGIQPSLPIKFFGYVGNMCGDADGVNGAEHVTAALLMADVRVGTTLKTRVLNNKSDREYREFYRKALMYKDLLSPSTALSPMVKVAVTGQNVAVKTNVRSCVAKELDAKHQDFVLIWPNGARENVNDVSSEQSRFRTMTPGQYVVKVQHANGAMTAVSYEVKAPVTPPGGGTLPPGGGTVPPGMPQVCATNYEWDPVTKQCVFKRRDPIDWM